MEFPITDLVDHQQSTQWIIEHFHVQGLHCPNPRCKAPIKQARHFRTTRRSKLQVYRCRECQQIYNIYSGTIFEGRHLTPQQVVLLIRGVLKGESSATIAAELGLVRSTVHLIRKHLQANAQALQPNTPLDDEHTETDEMFQNAGGKK